MSDTKTDFDILVDVINMQTCPNSGYAIEIAVGAGCGGKNP
nr:hypothetical protein [Bacillus atrophaeus]